MEAGSEECPIKVEASPEPEPEPEHNYLPVDETPVHNSKSTPGKKQTAISWFRRLPPEIKISLLKCCISLEAEYSSLYDGHIHAGEEFWSHVQDLFNDMYHGCRLRNWWFVRDCVRETCKFRYALLLRGAPGTPCCPQNELESHIDDWNEIVARRYRQLSNPMAIDPVLQKRLIECCLHFKKKLMNSDEDAYAPDVALWSAIVSRFNELVGGHILDDWESARTAVISICEPRYRMRLAGNLVAPKSDLDQAIDRWNRQLNRQQMSRALDASQSALWPIFQEKIKTTTERLVDEAIHKTNVTYIPRNLEEQQNLIARLGQLCKDTIKADREKIVRQLEDTTRPSSSTTGGHQHVNNTRKRKSRGDESDAGSGSKWDIGSDDDDDDDAGLLSKKHKHKRAVKQIADSPPKTKHKERHKRNPHKGSIERQLLALERRMHSIQAHLAQ